ncbi:hypothetical protein Gogos_015631 [Gossypium gossypioides]|uniref:Uncharacterized protein n=1 Tax=Gossypium gossypioides TaxID=34282 RepID=A0A7J9C2C1_GOSGO|nr:hypothetical protein [Gossypium gossypioides]
MGYAVKDCIKIPNLGEEKLEEDLPYSLALKVESNLVGKEILQFGFSVKKFMKQCLYIGENEGVDTSEVKFKKDTTRSKMLKAILHGKEILYKIDYVQIEIVTSKKKGFLVTKDETENSFVRNPRAIRRLRFTLKQHNPQMVFFMETKVDGRRMERVRRSCGFTDGFDVEA